MMATDPVIRVRMYRQGLGDCLLLTVDPEGVPVHVLIDCGTLGSTTTGVKIAEVAKDIIAETGGHLHALVVTHEHKDHVSGFTPKNFGALTVDRTFAAWTENPADADAVKLVKYEGDLAAALRLAANAFAARRVSREDRWALHDVRKGVRQILGFVGETGGEAPLGSDFAETVDQAMKFALGKSGPGGLRYLQPGDVLEEAWLPGVRVYVLGPPRDFNALKRMGDHGSAELYDLVEQLSSNLGIAAGFAASAQDYGTYRSELSPAEREEFDRKLPFDSRFRLEADAGGCEATFPAYYEEDAAWRRIDEDWLGAASDLALQLDNMTNNTSLALAFERIADGRVLLFPADAQLGNWMSWPALSFTVTDADGSERTVTSRDLLKRTVFYKVGHHGSHNATVNVEGLERMESDELVAMIPLDHEVAKNKSWTMPAHGLYARLVEKTRGRVLRSDTGWPEDKHIPADRQAEWIALRATSGVRVEPLYVEFTLS
jgi:hypothetical protein